MNPTTRQPAEAVGSQVRSGRAAVARAVIDHCARPAGRLTRLPMSITGEVDRTHRTIEMILTDFDRTGLILWIRKRPGGRHRPWWSVKVLDLNGLHEIAAEVRP